MPLPAVWGGGGGGGSRIKNGTSLSWSSSTTAGLGWNPVYLSYKLHFFFWIASSRHPIRLGLENYLRRPCRLSQHGDLQPVKGCQLCSLQPVTTSGLGLKWQCFGPCETLHPDSYWQNSGYL
jgi:hypothetical protein